MTYLFYNRPRFNLNNLSTVIKVVGLLSSSEMTVSRCLPVPEDFRETQSVDGSEDRQVMIFLHLVTQNHDQMGDKTKGKTKNK